MISSKDLLTTSGVLVRNGEGEVYMTVASKGFPSDDATVCHAKPDDLAIGEVVHRLGHTDIALAKLEDSISFENYTFQNSTQQNGVHLIGIRNPHDMERCDKIS